MQSLLSKGILAEYTVLFKAILTLLGAAPLLALEPTHQEPVTQSERAPAPKPIVALTDVPPEMNQGDLGVLLINHVFSNDTAPFEIRLAGGESDELVNTVTGSCSCVAVNFQPQLLVAKQTLRITGEFHAPNHDTATPYLQNITIQTERRTVRIALVANILPISETIAKPILFQAQEENTTITAVRKCPESFKLHSILNAVELADLGVRPFQDGRNFKVEFRQDVLRKRIASTRSSFPYRETVVASMLFEGEINTTNQGRLIGLRIPITLHDAGDILFQPERLSFPPQNAQSTAELKVYASSHRPISEELSLQAPDDIVLLVKRLDSKHLELTARRTPKRNLQNNPSFRPSTLMINLPGESYRIPISTVE